MQSIVDGVASALPERPSDDALTADELLRASGVEPAAGLGAIIELKLAGRVTREDGVYRVAV